MKLLARVALTLCLVLGLALAGLVWRLEQGPISLPWLARQAENAAKQALAGQRVVVAEAAISWAGWREGHRSPVAVRFTDIRLTDKDDGLIAALPQVDASLSAGALLRGHIALRALELRGLNLRAYRDGAGELSLGLAATAPTASTEPPEAALDALAEIITAWLAPPNEDTALSAIRRIALLDTRLALSDQRSGRVMSASLASLILQRRAAGGLDVAGRAVLELADQRIPVDITANLERALWRGEASFTARGIRPAALAGASAELAPLAALDAEAEVGLVARFAGAPRPDLLMGRLRTGAGVLHIPGNGGDLPFAAIALDATLAEDVVRVERLTLAPQPSPRAGASPPPAIQASGEARLQDGAWQAMAEVTLRGLDIADLPHYWPPSVAPRPREWLAENLTAGLLREGAWRVEARIGADGSGPAITGLSGTARAEAATVHWLRPIPPFRNAVAQARFALDAIDVLVSGGDQAETGIVTDGAVVRISFATSPETARIEARLRGPLADAWAVLRHPRLKIFERRPPPINDPTGTLESATLKLAFPLIKALDIEEIDIQAELEVRDLRIPRIAFDRDLERGVASVSLRNAGLTATGTGVLGDIEARIRQETDFRSGAATDIVAREIISARADARQLAALGLDGRPLLEGPVQIDLRNETRRNGQARLSVRADLRAATLSLEPLAWAKPPGTAGSAEAMVLMQGGAVTLIESFRIETPDSLIRGRASEVRQNLPQRIELNNVTLGRSRFSGDVRPPVTRAGGQWAITLRGPVLDMAPALAAHTSPDKAAEEGTATRLEARFDRVLLPHGKEILGLEAQLRVNALGVMQQASISARLQERGSFLLNITPEGQRRAFNLTSDNGGELLRAFDVLKSLQGGKLSVSASYDHSRPGATLSGDAVLEDFAVRDAPGLGKVLQAMTLYGMVDALSGPGLNFTRATIPFSLSPDALVMQDARAFSSSLGLTAKGRIDRQRDTLDLEGTIVPAYFFNTLLGRIPIFGRLFSPEEGGGLFAVSYRMRGPMNDPQTSINPLAALTPGFLRGIFGIGQEPAGQAPRQ
ncbi:MAG: hypothetical protein ING08_14460 [Roseomonas sp.]|nr:hypothetical protein [Roseomonas sp.]MCA3381430.1 hypothetical protein [Roseomonas sp.]